MIPEPAQWLEIHSERLIDIPKIAVSRGISMNRDIGSRTTAVFNKASRG
jgi:hypothetical protein